MKQKDMAQLTELIDSIIDNILLLELLEPISHLRDTLCLFWKKNWCQHLNAEEIFMLFGMLHEICIGEKWDLSIPGRIRQILMLICAPPQSGKYPIRSWCSLNAENIRCMREGKRILVNLWDRYPQEIQQEEERAFDQRLILLEDIFSESLTIYGQTIGNNAIMQKQIYIQQKEMFWRQSDAQLFKQHVDSHTIIKNLLEEKNRQLSTDNSQKSVFNLM